MKGGFVRKRVLDLVPGDRLRVSGGVVTRVVRHPGLNGRVDVDIRYEQDGTHGVLHFMSIDKVTVYDREGSS